MQLAHVEIGDSPVDLTDGLDPGCYLAQGSTGLGIDLPQAVLLFATAEEAPADDGDYFRLREDGFLTFIVSATAEPTWAKAARPDRPVTLALARQ